MKKAIALLLSVLCLFSCFTAVAGAIADLDILALIEEKDEDPLLYCIVYKKETLSGVKMMYKPNPSVTLEGPGYVKVTKDQPLAVDHQFVCWKDKNGKLYYAGDDFYVDGECTLYAVWEEKTDNLIRPIRVVVCAMRTMERMFAKAVGIFKDYQEFNANRIEAATRAVNAYNSAVNAAKAEQNIKIDMKSQAKISCFSCEFSLADATAKDKANEVYDKFEHSYSNSYTVTNGTTADGATANDLIRPFGKVSEITIHSSDIVSGSVQDLDDGGQKIVLVLAKEVAELKPYGKTSETENISKYMDPLDFAGKPELVNYADEINYSDTTIRAKTNSEGKLVSWSITAPITGSANIVIESRFADTTFEAVIRDDYKFTY